MRHVVVDVPQRALQPLQLQRGDLVARGDLDRVEVFLARCQVEHGFPFLRGAALPSSIVLSATALLYARFDAA